MLPPSLPPSLDGKLVHRNVFLSITFAGTRLCFWAERGTMRVKRLAQEKNTMSPSKTRTRSLDLERDERTNYEAPAPHGHCLFHKKVVNICLCLGRLELRSPLNLLTYLE